MQISLGNNPLHMGVRRQKFGIGSLIALLVIGVILIVSGHAFMNSAKIDKSWVETAGTVTAVTSSISNGSTLYSPVVTYDVSGRPYTVSSSVSTSSYPTTGSTKQVAYDPAYPSDAKLVAGTGSKALFYLLIAVGIAMVVLGPIFYIKSLRRSKDISNLQQTGQKRQGIITNIQTYPTNNNGGTRYRLIVTAQDDAGGTQNYKSDMLTGIGGLAMADYHSNPIPIDVYVSPSNPTDYYVDVSEVPNLTPERIGELIQTALHRQPQSAAPGIG